MDSSNIARTRRAYSITEDRGYDTPCWIWQGGLNKAGYAESYKCNTKWGTYRVHRANYFEKYGSISDGQKLENLCQNSRCVNPDHWQIKQPPPRPPEIVPAAPVPEPIDVAQPTLFSAERTKLCRDCGAEKAFSEFWNHPQCKDGLRPQCKDCIRQYNRDNIERRRVTGRRWQERNRDKQRAANRKSTEKRKREKPWLIYDQSVRTQEKAKLNPEYGAKAERKRRALMAGASGDGATLSELIAIHGPRCYLCQSAPATEVEHMTPLVRGGSNRPENLRPCCRSCNSSKGNKTYEEYLEYRAALSSSCRI